ncbi:MAG: helix-turn-helix domain-containing protein, partial [Candidatus Ventricola sp.]
MATEMSEELRRQLEEPLSSACRNYPLEDDALIVAMIDTPYYPPHMPDKPHVHNCLEIGVCLTGSGTVTLRDARWPFHAGSVIVAPRGVYHSQQNAGAPLTHWRYVVINDALLPRLVPEHLRASYAYLSGPFALDGLFLAQGESIGEVIRLMFDLYSRADDDFTADLELCTLLLLSLLGHQVTAPAPFPPVGQADTGRRQPIEPALTYVHAHYKEDITTGTLARCCSMSESYFRKQFLRIMGMPPLTYLNQYRIHRSMNLLLTTSDSIQNIAARCGFTSVS